MFSDAGITSVGKKLWNQKLHRMYSKNRGLRARIVKSFRRINLVSPGGIYIGRRLAQEIDEERLHDVAIKVVRGLYYFEYGTPLLRSTKVLCQLLRSESDAAEPIKLNDQLRSGSREWPEVFQYRFNRINQSPSCSAWLIRFWGKINFWLISGNDSDFEIGQNLSNISKAATTA